MIAILGWACGFEYTYVESLHRDLKEAEEYCKEYLLDCLDEYRWQEFDFGEADFLFEEAKQILFKNGKIKFSQKRGE